MSEARDSFWVPLVKSSGFPVVEVPLAPGLRRKAMVSLATLGTVPSMRVSSVVWSAPALVFQPEGLAQVWRRTAAAGVVEEDPVPELGSRTRCRPGASGWLLIASPYLQR